MTKKGPEGEPGYVLDGISAPRFDPRLVLLALTAAYAVYMIAVTGHHGNVTEIRTIANDNESPYVPEHDSDPAVHECAGCGDQCGAVNNNYGLNLCWCWISPKKCHCIFCGH